MIGLLFTKPLLSILLWFGLLSCLDLTVLPPLVWTLVSVIPVIYETSVVNPPLVWITQLFRPDCASSFGLEAGQRVPGIVL